MGSKPFNNAGAGAFSTPGVDTAQKAGPAAIITQNPVVTFKLGEVEPPSPLYIGAADRFALTCVNSDPNITQMLLNGRLLRASDGQVTPFNLTMPIGSTRAITTQLFDLTEGYLLTIEVLGNGGTNRGRCFVQLRVVRGQTGNLTEYNQLISDYFSRAHNPVWPGGQFISSVEGAGWVRRVGGTTPGAGAEILETVPANVRWRLTSFRSALVTSAAVANRQVRYLVDDGATTIYAAYASAVEPASGSVNYTLVSGGPGANLIVNEAQIPAPAGLQLFAGWRVRTLTDNIQAADQYSGVNYEVEEWIEL